MQNIVFTISADSKNAQDALKSLQTEIKKVQKGLGDTEGKGKDGMDGIATGAKKAETQVSGLQSSLTKMGAALVAGFAVSSVINFGKEVARVRAEMEGMQIRMQGIYNDSVKANQAMDSLRLMAEKYGIELKSLSNDYIQFVSAAKASGVEIGKAEKIFKSMTVAIAGAGVSTEVGKRAFVALTQMLGKNQIMAEELRGQLGEALPQAVGIMAKSLGVTTQELGKMMEKGELIASEVLPKFAEEMEKALGGTAQELAGGLNAEMNRLENAWTRFYTTVGDSGIIENTLSILTTSVNVLTASVAMLSGEWGKYQQEAINAQRALLLDESGKRIFDQINNRVDALRRGGLTEQEIIDELRASYDKYATEYDDNTKKIERSKNRMFGSAGITEAFVRETELAGKTRDLILDQINELEKKASVNAGNVELSKAELKELEKIRIAQQKILQDIEAMRRRALLATKTDVGKIRQKNEFEAEDLQANPAFLALTKEQQADILNEIDNQTNEQIQQKIESLGKGLKKLDAYEKQAEAENKSGDMIAKIVSGVGSKFGRELDDLQNLEDEKQHIRVAMAMQTFDLLATLGQNYANAQVRQLDEQLQKGVISQEAYEAQIRKIKRKEAIMNKAGALFQIGINTAIGVSSPANLAALGALSPLIIALGALQAATVIAQPIPYNKGTKRVPMMRGAVRGQDSVHAILTPDERVVPADINNQQGYSALMDLAQDKKISNEEAGFIAKLATSGMGRSSQGSIDYDELGRSIAKHIPHTDVRIDDNGIAIITERRTGEINRLKSRL